MKQICEWPCKNAVLVCHAYRRGFPLNNDNVSPRIAPPNDGAMYVHALARKEAAR